MEHKGFWAKSKVITDVQKPYIDELTDEQNKFWLTLDGKKKNTFLYMNNECRSLCMSDNLNAEDEEILWEHGGKLAFHYSNSGMKQSRLVKGVISSMINFALLGAGVCLSQDLYFNTYAKNRQLNLESLSIGDAKFELVPLELLKLNNAKGLLDQEEAPPANAMPVTDYLTLIQKPDFKCGKLESLSQSFKSADGYPLCKENSLGDKYVVGYVKRSSYPEIITSVIHDGKIYNLDFDKEFGISTVKIVGADTVTKDRVINSFAATFPDAVREYKANAVTKYRKQ
jgi:hypothetical protein